MELAGFKEWKLVCDALQRGRQSLLIRKGGIAEGKDGFRWRESAFFLFPSYFHSQIERLRIDWETDRDELPTREREQIEIRLWAELEATWEVEDLDRAGKLEPYHVWRDEVVNERFGYGDQPGLHVALVRIYRLAEPWLLPNRKSFGGCRSWVSLPGDEGLPGDWHEQMRPAMDEKSFGQLRSQLTALLG